MTSIRFCHPVVPEPDRIQKYFEEDRLRGHIANFSPAHEKFSSRLSEFLNLSPDKKLTLTSSGHTSLMAALNVLECERLLVPDFTFESTRAAGQLQGIDTLAIDVDPTSGCLTKEILESASEEYDSVALVCALSTIPNLPEIASFCRQEGKKLIVDGAPTFGTPGIFNYGDAFCLSLHGTKSLPVGEGGAVITSTNVSNSVRQFINFGFGPDRRPVRPGMNAKMSGYASAVGLALMDDVSSFIELRLTNSQIYLERLGSLVPSSSVQETVYAFMPIFMPTARSAAEAHKNLALAGVESKRYYLPLEGLPVASDLYERSVCVPCHQGVLSEQVHFICDIILGV